MSRSRKGRGRVQDWTDPSWWRKRFNRSGRRVARLLTKLGREVPHWKRQWGWFW